LLAVLSVAGASDAPQIGALPHRDVLLRVLNLALDLVGGVLQCVRARDVQVAARAGISIEIDSGVLAKFILMLFDPLSGPEQARLFAVPCAINDGALRTP